MTTAILRAVALAAAAFLPAVGVAEALSFEEALRLAALRSNAARAARAAASGAAESARFAGQLPDPVFRAGIDNVPISGTDRFSSRDSMTMKRVGIGQEWLSVAKRTARQTAAEAMAEREAVQALVAESEARVQVALAYLDAWYAEATLKLTQQTEHHLHEEREASRARVAAATSGSADVLQLTSALGIAEDESEEARQQYEAAKVSLHRWVGFRPDALTGTPILSIPTEQEFLSRHPALATLQRDLDIAQQNAVVTATERSPNWTWEVSYSQRAGNPDMWSLGVSIPLQVAPSQRQDRETAAKRALVTKAEAELAEASRAALAEYRTMVGDVDRLQQRIERYGSSVLSPAQQRTAAALAAYGANQEPLTALFEARHAEVEAQRKLLSLQRDLSKSTAELMLKPIVLGFMP